jgi:hypothetical protein
MIKTFALLLTAFAATAALAEGALPSSTDEARAEAAKRTAMANHDASLRPFVPLDSDVVFVSDTDSARRVAAQANARHAHDTHLADVLRAGAGINPTPITVTDTDSARAAAAQQRRASSLKAAYRDYVKMRAKAERDLSGASTSVTTR